LARYIIYKRWQLEDSSQAEDMVLMVRDEIAPAYRQLEGCLGMALEHIEGTTSYLAIQHWVSEAVATRTLETHESTEWYANNRLLLHCWMSMLSLEEEWATIELVPSS